MDKIIEQIINEMSREEKIQILREMINNLEKDKILEEYYVLIKRK